MCVQISAVFPPCCYVAGKRLRAAGVALSPVPLTLGLHGTGSTSSNGSNGSSNILKFAVPPRAVVYELPELRVQYSSASTGTSHAEQPVVSSPKETTCANLAVAEGGLTRSLGHVSDAVACGCSSQILLFWHDALLFFWPFSSQPVSCQGSSHAACLTLGRMRS
jgi:hypothetical protein